MLNGDWQIEQKFAQGTVFVPEAIDICSFTLFPSSSFHFRFRFRMQFDFRYAYLFCSASSLALRSFKSATDAAHERRPFCSLQCSCPLSFYSHIPQVLFDIILPP